MRNPTIKDVAKRARVSLKTVSRVINNEPSVQDRTRAKVQRAIDELHYQPDLSARSLYHAIDAANVAFVALESLRARSVRLAAPQK